ncbi:MAG: MarR family transcriptional regulator [Nevskiales bacterium]|nr:MarR family transcriptional regulator [Nevskiales bacterium]
MPNTPEADLIVALTHLQSRIEKQLSGPLSVHGISLTEFLVMRQLQRAPHGRLRRIDLAQGAGLSASGITRLLGPMEKIGLVEKVAAERDARVSLMALSKAGARIYREAEATFAEAAATLLAPLGDRDRTALARIVGTLL